MSNIFEFNIPNRSCIKLNDFIISVDETGNLLVTNTKSNISTFHAVDQLSDKTLDISPESPSVLNTDGYSFRAKVSKILIEILGLETVAYNEQLIKQSKDIDSLDLAEIEMEINDQFNIDLGINDVQTLAGFTPNDLFEKINDKLVKKEQDKLLQEKIVMRVSKF